jgi:hypothetical protein
VRLSALSDCLANDTKRLAKAIQMTSKFIGLLQVEIADES